MFEHLRPCGDREWPVVTCLATGPRGAAYACPFLTHTYAAPITGKGRQTPPPKADIALDIDNARHGRGGVPEPGARASRRALDAQACKTSHPLSEVSRTSDCGFLPPPAVAATSARVRGEAVNPPHLRSFCLSNSGRGGIRTPGRRCRRQRFSRPPHSTALPPFRDRRHATRWFAGSTLACTLKERWPSG